MADEAGDDPERDGGDPTPEAGDDLDCPHCGARHEVRRGKAVRVKGFARRVEGSLYVDCPESGVLAVTEDGVEAIGENATSSGDDGSERDWP